MSGDCCGLFIMFMWGGNCITRVNMTDGQESGAGVRVENNILSAAAAQWDAAELGLSS